ncbi:tripartite tricarboxylate transporter substrate binding protein [Bordetella bronchiseptica]|uniref:tripartite tricarboxylate transporter substrate binding protein n=1 Tax=Bordetella bronchiseptica TaxID=518 RepID=UPI0004A14C87|nr:tripartite tricarboxylate transporter substrate binding protein [Bordetella bronchiseptica]KDB68766.1 tripartite tricarboxylate transporter family receptor [Bordetella bronchiseptica B20-10725633]
MKFTLTCAAAALGLALASPAGAAADSLDWPARQITWLVGFVPGGTADVLTRIAAQELARNTGLNVVVENRPGASGAIALQLLARSKAADGYLLTVPGPIIYPTPQPEVGAALAPVVLMAQGPMVVVGPAKDARADLQAVLADARKRPEAWSYGSSGTGTSQHLAGELLNQYAGTRIVHVPYKGGGQAVADVSGGQIPLAILGSSTVLPQIKSGALKGYAVTTTYRLDSLPEVPTVAQSGFKDFDASQWFSVAASNTIAARQLDQMNAALRAAMDTPQFKTAVANAGMAAGGGSREDLLKFIQTDRAKWRKLIDSGAVKLD